MFFFVGFLAFHKKKKTRKDRIVAGFSCEPYLASEIMEADGFKQILSRFHFLRRRGRDSTLCKLRAEKVFPKYYLPKFWAKFG